ncbi:MAG: hypothetical protein B6242_16945 [Anaerolineaceae bacterium 4572_78]|nr:MAG: hypothetical protein B6242_16945 [Anaerolineaceae bacterium 4572_78]
MPSFNHSYVQMKLGSILIQLDKYNIHSELTLTINDKDYTPDIVLYPKQKMGSPAYRMICEDEMRSFVGNKKNKYWIWLAIDRDTREIVVVYR